MLTVYTFVFSVIFKARWGVGGGEDRAGFAIVLFVGIIVHGLFAECTNRAPGLILANVNYVKKVVFPLEILPWVAMGSTLFHSGISLLVLLLAQLLLNHTMPLTAVFFPIIILPLLLLHYGRGMVPVGHRRLPARCQPNRRYSYHSAFVPLARLLSPFRPARGVSDMGEIKPSHLYPGRRSQITYIWPDSRRGRLGYIYVRQYRDCVDGFLVVSEIAQGVCRCPLRKSPFAWPTYRSVYEIYDRPPDRLKQSTLPKIAAVDPPAA